MIKNAGHLPMRKSDGEDFATLIQHAAKAAQLIKEHSSEFLINLPNCKNGNPYGEDFNSFFTIEFTLQNMIKFYDFILLKRKESYLLNNDITSMNKMHNLACPCVMNIEGNKITIGNHHFPINDKAIQILIDKHFCYK